MTSSNDRLRSYLQAFDFRSLFIEGLGWDNYTTNPLTFEIQGTTYTLRPISQKAGYAAYLCEPGPTGEIAPYKVQRRLELLVSKTSFEHVIIFVDRSKTVQYWQFARREAGRKPAPSRYEYHAGQSGTPLLQRLNGIAFDFAEEARGIGIADVTTKVRAAMDVEKVTKRFYERFSKELKEFGGFIEGITAEADRDWYASLMLNRMMFVYFFQKKGFLDGDTDYLRNKLAEVRGTYGNGQFQGFYREFLLRLFHEGLGKPENERDDELKKLLGDVPFLNGGLFDPHELEETHTDISISDETFERVFEFFDAYRWHLDERPNREDNEINPDVLGYIFEKYVNQKQMGAYYTKEDITGYISRNTVIPFLFDAARKKDNVAFQPDGGVWRLLKDDPDRYIYPAVGHGITWNARDAANPERLGKRFDLPPDIVAGIDDVSKRGGWNIAAPDDYALPTETWREVVARRQRHAEVRSKLASGEMTEINDLITLNLDIEQFARDVIAQSEGPDLLRAFWQALRGNENGTQPGISVLDPTCGSGAFLFAALNILEPLYTACLEGMRGFVADLERAERPHSPNALSDFRDVLAQVEKHPNERYYILKSIVLNNLYGVDIMEEAVEICKLRLFLKLVAQLENYEQIEPLPDIDFNIRAGNTLVGFTTLDAVREAMTVTPDGQSRQMFPEEREILNRIEEAADEVSSAATQFRWQQTFGGGQITTDDKHALRDRLSSLTDELDLYLAKEYGIDIEHYDAFVSWRASHQPFHWFAEFHGIMSQGGFDVVIGNPPYVEYSKILKGTDEQKPYSVHGYTSESCGNLYAFTWERSVHLAAKGQLGMIVPASATSTDGYEPLRKLLMEAGNLVVSSFSDNPGRLFDGMPHNRLQIILLDTGGQPGQTHASIYRRWQPPARDYLFADLATTDSSGLPTGAGLAKIGYGPSASILHKLMNRPLVSEQQTSPSPKFKVYYTRKLGHWVQVLDFVPKIYDSSGILRSPSELKEIHFDDALVRDGALAMLNSSLFAWLVQCLSDCRNLNRREVSMIRFDVTDSTRLESLAAKGQELMKDISKKSELKKQGGLTIQQTFPRFSKPIIDEIDTVLAEHYGFTDEELDFIINYDIKYRMGR